MLAFDRVTMGWDGAIGVGDWEVRVGVDAGWDDAVGERIGTAGLTGEEGEEIR
jgi:hypothetical protein